MISAKQVPPEEGGPGWWVDPADKRAPERKSASHGEAGYERKERDFYPTEPWVTRALCQAVDFCNRDASSPYLIWEPAVGDGRMADELKRARYRLFGSDIRDYGWPTTAIIDFVRDPLIDVEATHVCAAVVTNPPFDLAKLFIVMALEVTKRCRGKVAILQRHEFDAPASNHPLFAAPFAAKLILHKRPRWSDDDKASPRFPYAWYLWDWRHQGPPILRYLPDPDKPANAVGALL